MTWSPLWEDVFQAKEWGRYPPLALVRFIAQNYYNVPDRSQTRVLELGCGPGANIWYMAREGLTVSGIDGSPSAIEIAEKRLTEEGGLSADLIVGDINHIDTLYEAESFDAVVDVNCLQCSTQAAIVEIVSKSWALLKPGGKMFSVMMGSGSWGEGLGTEIAPGTYTDIKEGPCSDSEVNHFATEEDIQEAFGLFSDIHTEWIKRSYVGGDKEFKLWLIESSKGGAE